MPFAWFAAKPAAIDDALWRSTVEAMPFALHLDAQALERLRALCEEFLRRKTFTGTHGLEITPGMRTAIAAQACLPALNLGLRAYDDFVEIVVYPDQFLVPRKRIDDAGVVHESLEALAGEAMDRGPVVLSWADAAPGEQAANVTIHEFVHKIDLADGEADGIPPLPPRLRARWEAALHEAYDDFCDWLDEIERAIPRHVDPESEAADPWFADLPLDPYAATDPAEFFAVSGEAFFTAPEALSQVYPQWYTLLADFFRQDPLSGAGNRP